MLIKIMNFIFMFEKCFLLEGVVIEFVIYILFKCILNLLKF